MKGKKYSIPRMTILLIPLVISVLILFSCSLSVPSYKVTVAGPITTYYDGSYSLEVKYNISYDLVETNCSVKVYLDIYDTEGNIFTFTDYNSLIEKTVIQGDGSDGSVIEDIALGHWLPTFTVREVVPNKIVVLPDALSLYWGQYEIPFVYQEENRWIADSSSF